MGTEAVKQAKNINIWLDQLNEESKAAISVDCVIFGYDDESIKILTIESDMPPHLGKRSLIGDLVKKDENLDGAAQRVLETVTGLKGVHIQQVHAFADPGRHPLGRVLTVAYYSLIKIEEYTLTDFKDKGLKWMDIHSLQKMAFDHKEILDASFSLLQRNVRTRPIGFELLPKKFTLQELQSLYEAILGISFDKRNFRRKLRSIDILLDLDEFTEGNAHRPAKLYSFDHKKFKAVSGKKEFNFQI